MFKIPLKSGNVATVSVTFPNQTNFMPITEQVENPEEWDNTIYKMELTMQMDGVATLEFKQWASEHNIQYEVDYEEETGLFIVLYSEKDYIFFKLKWL